MECHHDPGKSMLLSLSSSSSNSHLTMPGVGGHNMVDLRSLILYKACRNTCIYNPTTRQSLTLPAVKSNIFAQQDSLKYVFYYLGHDPVLDQYKVVCNVALSSQKDFKRITSEHWVLVLKAGDSWTKKEFDQSHLPTKLGSCSNGVIHYLATTSASRPTNLFCFDVRSQEFNMIKEVPEFGEHVRVIEYGGKLTVFDHTHLPQNGLVDLWVLEDGGKWSRKPLALQPSQMHLVDGINQLVLKCTTQNGDIILVPNPMPSSSYFLFYDPQKNDLQKVNVSVT
ncbi:unnamed protein product [Thlaspi arvense]|uniref:F-box associated beta-propeller type 3 domain-containing protein n=1 Tax=Thlaspi arvense TaxID=13288 RepID=A0AAU9SA46_THLAR|nr:unnamed protein product [Thlaspi arvense]